ncbi:DEHA2E01958p [Debaryomyces hansenii CBS767]|uniref:DEHA2E01958p n=1 Tax=Debaryomyces hansenii (strain ATCC 36239 / CBS 767 / BCRC 21394 / JCM 1990 / NBRC 0083 / IGC 2968) TaxID=284592 RepID=Q6BQV3_DEBHA|nr:DEHA2E01958p [Debaryomyces hansenii CBS767]CAG87628.2 DEHA2E01958p [Debaryomyces hansenii CBS767]|eukprot:XP_459417.2 DEHA2E01958p [Debaryomyces hansenii CBS767]
MEYISSIKTFFIYKREGYNREMSYSKEMGKPPQTPPRKGSSIEEYDTEFRGVNSQQEFVNALSTPVTESRKSIKILKTSSETINNTDQEDEGSMEIPMTPDFTPQKRKRNRKYSKGSISKSIHATPRSTRPTEAVSPSSPGTGGSKTNRYSSTKRIRPISLGLQLSLAQEESSSEETGTETNYGSQPIPHTEHIRIEEQMATPKGKIIDESLVNAWHGKSLNNDFSSDDELSDYENMMLKNDILENNGNRIAKTNRQQIHNPFGSAPFNLNTKTNIHTSPAVDYSTHAEYYNNKTGERIIRELTEDEKRIKPKKLNFRSTPGDNDQIINEARQSSIDDSGNQEKSVGDKFLLNNLNRFMVDSKPKSSLGFEIFKDDGN